MNAGDDFCKLDYTKEDMSDMIIKLDRSKILTTGKKGKTVPSNISIVLTMRKFANHTLSISAVGDFLQKLHVYKSTADVENGTRFFRDEMSAVGLEYWGTKVRDVVLANKQPRKVFVQANTRLDDKTGKVSCEEYEPTLEGMVKSWVIRESMS